MAGSNTEKPTGKAEQKKQVMTQPKVEKKKVENAPIKKEDKKVTEKKTKKEKVKAAKKEKVIVNIRDSPVSLKYSIAICKFIKNKKIQKAIEELQSVTLLKKPIPMKGEIPHRKGKIMSGRFPVRASREFITILKSLQANADQHDVVEPIITEAVANKGTSVYGKMGRTKKKKTHLKIVATEKNKIKKKK